MPSLVSTFARDARGSVALMFGLVAIVLIGLVGAAFDYSRMALMQTSLQRAVDASVLLVARNREIRSGYTLSDADAKAYLVNTFDVDKVSNLTVSVTLTGERVRLDASGDFPMTLSAVIGLKTRPIRGSAEALFGDIKTEIALVLDNTGSMGQLNKLETLKSAATRFVDKMKASVTHPESMKIALVPFDTDVNLGSLKSAPWVDPSAAAVWAARPSTAGCVWDRDQPYDVSDTPPDGAGTAFTADSTRTSPCSLAPIVPLTNDYPTLYNAIDAMTPSGNTNTTIGLAWGFHVLTRSEPVTGAAAAGTKNLTKYIIFMTDGENTQNRWTHNANQIDSRMRQVCANIKQASIQIFTVRIIEGNASVLQECATSSDMYYDIQTVAQFDPVFDKIYALITGTRISR